ncbi:protein FAM200B-like [Styela clava]
MKPSKLLRHLESKHVGFKDKPLEFFQRREQYYEEEMKLMRVSSTSSSDVLMASYLVASRIAKSNKPFTIGEQLILPTCKDICREVVSEAAAKKIAQVPLSARTVSRRVEDIAEYIESELIERINKSPWFALQCDESIDISDNANFLVYVRYLYQEDIHEDMLCLLLLPTKTTAAELFKFLNDYISGKLNWNNCVGVCTDGAAAMIGRLSGLVTRNKEVAPNCNSTHCVIHGEMLASKKMSPELNEVMNHVVKVNNFIRAHSLNSRLFAQLCEDMEAEHRNLLLHTEIRWLSRGKSLNRDFDLRLPLRTFLMEKRSQFAEQFNDKQWLQKLAYLCDIFSLLNDLNLSLQVKMTTVFV